MVDLWKLKREINFQSEFESECFSFVEQTLDLRHFIFLVKERLFPDVDFQDYQLLTFRGQIKKLRKLLLLYFPTNETDKLHYLKISNTCFTWLLKNLDFILTLNGGVLEYNNERAEAKFDQEFELDHGIRMMNIERIKASPFSMRIHDGYGDETCDCYQIGRSCLGQEGFFLFSILNDLQEDHEAHFLKEDLQTFVEAIDEWKEGRGSTGQELELKMVSELMDDHFDWETYLELVDSSDQAFLLNEFLFSLCLLVTRRTFLRPCCSVSRALHKSSIRPAPGEEELFS